MVHLWASNRVAMMNVAAADSRRRSSPLRGSPPFSGANAAVSYPPLQLTLRPEMKMLKIRPGNDWFYGQSWENRRFVWEMAGFTDITGVADINVTAVVAAGGPSHFVGPFF